MNILVVYTHPNKESLNYAFLQHVLDGCNSNENVKEVRVIDLYAEGFDPLLQFNKTKQRSKMNEDPKLEPHRELVKWANKLVFVYPIWWGRPPAMLLGLFDQLFAKDFAYRYTKKHWLLPEGLLKGKSVVCISTMQGPSIYSTIWLRNAHKVLMRKAVFNFIGIKRVKFFEFGNMESVRGKHHKKLNKVLNYFSKVAY